MYFNVNTLADRFKNARCVMKGGIKNNFVSIHMKPFTQETNLVIKLTKLVRSSHKMEQFYKFVSIVLHPTIQNENYWGHHRDFIIIKACYREYYYYLRIVFILTGMCIN